MCAISVLYVFIYVSACECDVRGTLNGSSVCHPNGTGVCPCKKYVTGRQCNQCMDGYYGLNTNNTEGKYLIYIYIYIYTPDLTIALA